MFSKKGRILFVILVMVWLVWQGKPTFSAAPESSGMPEISLLADGLQLIWQVPPLVETIQPDGTVVLALPGFEIEQRPGWPALPVASLLVALPPEAEPTLVFSEDGVVERPFTQPLAINPEPEGVLRDEAGNVLGGATVAAEPVLVETPVLSLEEAGMLRGVRLARLTFRPIQLVGQTLRLTEAISATIEFHTPSNAERPVTTTPDLLQTAVANQVINPSQIIIPANDHQPAKPTAPVPTVLLEVAAPGMTAVSYADLQVAGFPVGTVNPAHLQLWYDGAERPLEWFGDGDAQFETGESFRFYAAPWFSRWLTNDVYTLTAGSTPGSRMGSQAASPNGLSNGTLTLTAVAEQNNQYTPDCVCGQLPAGRDGDRWVWEDLRQPGRPASSYTIDLPYVNKNQSAQLTLWAVGFTGISANPDHHLNVTFNGSGVGSISWDGKTAVTHTLTLPASSLQANNTLDLAIPVVSGVAIDGLWLDAFSVRYGYNGAAIAAGEQLFVAGATARRAYAVALGSSAGLRLYDVTQPAAPALLNSTSLQNGQVSWGDPNAGGHNYLITNSSSLHTPAAVRLPRSLPSGSADMIIISHANFISALTPLKSLRQSQGLSVKVVDVQAIYDQYGNGRLSPAAIRNYLTDLYQIGTPTPTYVLLVGDGSSDPKQYRADSHQTWLPPYLAVADPWVGEVAADNRFVAVDGVDLLPDMAIGRLPVNSLAEAQTVVSKIVAYETEPFWGDWNGRLTFVSDDTDAAGNFAAHSASLAQTYVNDPWQATLLNYNPAQLSEAAMQTQVKQQWQAGQGLLIYTGHSSIHQWGAERFFHLDDVAGLRNGARLPVVLEMTCFTGSFAQPFWDTLDEALLRQPNGGAVAVWGATGLGVGTGHDALASGFLDSLMVQNEARLGTAVLAGKLDLFINRPVNQDLLDTFTLLGDPAMHYNFDFEPGLSVYLPLVSR